ncbi:tetratricopeptide repeat protein [Bacillus sp. FJAT-50079]|uniref:tetratricopeptide repeat protein n=1 Tax=Bacillus sp. FJAT-50079 TaxID=2833577 RepID=UPI001BC9DC53|nr:tetratricopeptide repeat protein [Bacillus sp. FJAT-50079]MBS4208923.1 tetratricopeptide repeat protein [Bacillus sp. FJAT-50079]
MKKDQHDQDANKIILFPGLKERLYEKGIAHMEKHDFEKAIDLLSQAKEMDSQNPDISTALVVALYENNELKESRGLAEELLHEGIGDYYEILDIYLMILIQLNEHEHVVATIEALFEEREVPAEKEEHFHTLLGLSEKVMQGGSEEEERQATVHIPFANAGNLEEQTIFLGSLADKNIHPYLDSLIHMLADDQTHPFLQTIVLNVLRENKIEKKVKVCKLELRNDFIPAALPPLDEMPALALILSELTDQLDDHNPVLLEQLKVIIERHAFIMYPFELNHMDPSIWALAYRKMGYEMYGEEWDDKKMATIYDVDPLDIQHASAFLDYLEQISSPII